MFEIGKDILKNNFKAVFANPIGARRLRFMHIVFLCLFIVFIGYTLYLGAHGTNRARRGNGAGNWDITRADIIDRNGDILATNIMSGHIVLRPAQVIDKDAAATLIHNVLPIEYSFYDALGLVNSDKKFIYLKKLATPNQRADIVNAKIQGLGTESVQTRKYPKRRLFSHIVGFVGGDSNGQEGAERVYNNYLIENKDPLQLSLDSRIQSVFYEELTIAMQKYQARSGTGLLINSRTGEMIAMVSLPDFDPENLSADPISNRMFMPMRGVFEMGSVFKIFNTAMALENGITREYYIATPYKILDKFGRTAATISDVKSFKPPRPNLSVPEIMMYSCNPGSAQIALDLPNGTQQEFLSRIHMDAALDLEFGRTERTLFPKNWGPVEKATVAIGHGISVTPMHVLLGVNSMTNGGFYIYPTLKKRDVGAVSGKMVISNKISEILRGVMFRIAEETTAKKARIAGINIGGKTGTAEKRINGKIDKFKNITVFVGSFPIEAPQYTIMIMLDEPRGVPETFGLRTAAWNAVPVAGKILDGILPLLFN